MSDTSTFNISILVSTEGAAITAPPFTVEASVQPAEGTDAASEKSYSIIIMAASFSSFLSTSQ